MSSLVKIHLTGGGPSDGRKFVQLKSASKLQEKTIGGGYFWMYLDVYTDDKACIYAEAHPRGTSESEKPDSLTLWHQPGLNLQACNEGGSIYE